MVMKTYRKASTLTAADWARSQSEPDRARRPAAAAAVVAKSEFGWTLAAASR